MEMIILLKFIGISAILTILYYAIYARSASYFQCRIFLTAILFVSMAIAMIQVKIYPAAVRTVEAAEETVVSPGEYYNENTPIAPSHNVNVAEKAMVTMFTLSDWLFLLYITVTALLLLKYFYQLYKIINITRWGSVTVEENYKLVRNSKVASPFSYFKNIYINRKLDNETLEVVLQHELCHIEHRHYIDTLLMEFSSIFLWFNPLTWVIKHELRDIHEFQVDNSMIRNGLDIPKYQNILFAELMGYSPNIANGLHNSLIKKRFIMMNHNRIIKHGWVRKILILPIVALLIVLFSFKEKDDVIRYVPITTNVDVVSEQITITETPPAEKVEPKQELQRQQETLKIAAPVIAKDTIIVESVVTKTIKNENDSIVRKTVVNTVTQYIELNKNQFVVSNWKIKKPEVKFIEPMADKTLVTIVVPIEANTQGIEFGSDLCIKNPKTGERFPIIAIMRNIPLDKAIIVNGMKGKCLEFTIVFPSLKKDMFLIDICAGDGGHFRVKTTTCYEPSEREKKQIPIISSFFFSKLDIEKYKKIDYNYYDLTAEQTPVIKIVNANQNVRLLSVTRTATETLVSFTTRICYDAQWICFDSGMVLRDCKTKEKYYIKNVAKEIPLNRVCVVKGKKNEFVMYTMVFPRLRDEVDKIDIITVPHINNVPTPPSNVSLNWYEVNVRNNKFNPDNNYTLQKINTTHPAARLETTIESKGRPKMLLRINNNRPTDLIITLNKSEVINIPSGFAIRDVASGKLFRARSVYPYNFDTTIGGQKGDAIVLEFENLPYGVDRIDMGVFTKEGEVEHPWSYKNIEINN